MDNRYRKMEPSTLESGDTVRLMVKEVCYIQTVTSMKVNGKTTNATDMEPTLMPMALNILENGKKINSMEEVRNSGLTDLNTKVNIKTASKMAMDSSSLPTEVPIKEDSRIMRFTVMENT